MYSSREDAGDRGASIGMLADEELLIFLATTEEADSVPAEAARVYLRTIDGQSPACSSANAVLTCGAADTSASDG